jgi:predicted dehydrogenase
VKSPRTILAGALSRLVPPLTRLVGRVEPGKVARRLRAAEALLARIDREHPALGPVGELREIAEEDPHGLEVIRRVLREGRAGQVASVVRGMLIHRAFARPIPRVDPAPALAKAARRGESLVVALIGGTADLAALREEYARTPGCRVLDAARPGEIPADARIAEIADPAAASENALADALRRGVAVSLHPAAMGSPASVARLCAAAVSSGAAFRVYAPILDYPPLRALRDLLADDAIGEIGTIRVRAIVGGRGGARPPLIPDREDYLAHPAFDHFVLLAALGGPLAAATAYLNPMDRVAGGQGVVACRFAHPGRYGSLECAWAPDLFVRSAQEPYDLEVEVAGTDGIVWLRRGVGKRTQGAPVELRVGREWRLVGAGSGLAEEWSDALRESAVHFAARARGLAAPRLADGELLSALRLRARARDAARDPGVVAI